MRLTDILHPKCIRVPLQADDKQGAIFELIDLLTDHLGLDQCDELKKAVWQREQTRTTGIGHGVAIPHGKSTSCRELSLAIGKTAKPLEFGAIDNRPVHLIFLLVSPADQTGPHIQALASISRMLTDESVRTNMKQVTSADDLYHQITTHDATEVA